MYNHIIILEIYDTIKCDNIYSMFVVSAIFLPFFHPHTFLSHTTPHHTAPHQSTARHTAPARPGPAPADGAACKELVCIRTIRMYLPCYPDKVGWAKNLPTCLNKITMPEALPGLAT